MPKRLHVFDMDGTLLNGTATLELARHFGQPDVGLDIEQRWQAGQITDREFWSTLLATCAHATEADLDAAFLQANWLDGIIETFADIRARDEVAVVISQSPIFFVGRLRRWGAHETYGSDVMIGRALPSDATLLPAEKVAITKDVLARLSIGPDCCVAYGDSSSDMDLFGWLGNTVSVNGGASISRLAAAEYRGDDIRSAYAIGRRMLDLGSSSVSESGFVNQVDK